MSEEVKDSVDVSGLSNFTEVFTSESFDAIKGTVRDFLKLQHSSNATLEFPDKTVYLHQHKGAVVIHIIEGDRSEAPELPPDEYADEPDE